MWSRWEMPARGLDSPAHYPHSMPRHQAHRWSNRFGLVFAAQAGAWGEVL